jgi:hypothetical protein
VKRGAPLIVAAFVALASSAAAQDCYPAPGSNEAEVFAILSVPLAFSPAGMTGGLAPGAVRAGLELTAIPSIDTATATPLTCRPGKGPESANLMPLLPRPRVSIGLPGAFALEASWIPPLRVAGIKANLFGLALGRRFAAGRSLELTIRGHATIGTVRAPITCDDDALQDSTSECFGGRRSDDAYKPNIFGAEVAVTRLSDPRIRPYLGFGYNVLRPRFQVNFTNSAGDTDNSRVMVNLSRAVAFGGLTWFPRGRIAVSGELYVAPKDAFTARITVWAAR